MGVDINQVTQSVKDNSKSIGVNAIVLVVGVVSGFALFKYLKNNYNNSSGVTIIPIDDY